MWHEPARDLPHEIEMVKAAVLAQLFSDIRVQRYAGIHHFVSPDQIYTLAHAKSLLELWHRAQIAAETPTLVRR